MNYRFYQIVWEIDLITENERMKLRSDSKKETAAVNIAYIVKDEYSKIVLDNNFVSEYFRKLNSAANGSDANQSVVSLTDSSDDEHEKSVVFVSEEKPPETSSKNECVALRAENKKLHNRMRHIEVNMADLQKRINNEQPVEPAEPSEIDLLSENSVSTETNAPVEDGFDGLNAIDISIDEQWVNEQIQQLQNDGNYTALAADIEKHLE